MEWKNLYRGLMIGASDLVPGISGGTIALLLGIYEQLIEAINGFFSRNWKKHLGFLIPLGIGIVTAIFVLAKGIEWLFVNHPTPTIYFFLGLIIGVLPYLFYKADAKRTFQLKHIGFLIIGALLISFIGFFSVEEGEIITNASPSTYLLLFISGLLGSAAMIIPGISGSFMLLVLGVYPTVISAITNLRFPIIIVTGLGIVLGFILMSRIIGYFLKTQFSLTFATAIGLVIGAAIAIFPGVPLSFGVLAASIVTFSTGLFTAYILGRIEYK